MMSTETLPRRIDEACPRTAPAPSFGRRFAHALKRRPSNDVLWLTGGQALLALGQLAGVRFLTETVPPEIYGTVSIVLGLVVLGRSQFSLPFAMASMRHYAEASRRDDVGMFRRVIRYWLLRAQGVAAALILFLGVPYCLSRSISLWLPALAFGLFVVDSEITLAASFLNASKRHKTYSLVRGAEAWIRPLLAVGLVYLLGPSAAVVLVGYFVGGSILVAVIALSGSRTRAATTGPIDQEVTRRVWRFCLPLFPSRRWSG